MTQDNPFTPTFGFVPAYMAGRQDLLEDLSTALANGVGDPNLSTIVYGARGTGKTALLSFVAEEAASQGWLCAGTTASEGMLEDILNQATLVAHNFLDTPDRRRLTGVAVGQLVSFEWENTSPRAGNWRTQMSVLLDQLAQYDIGLLITVDEASAKTDEMKQLVRVYQHFVRERRKVALLMAGLPHAVSSLLADDDVSFIRRARKHSLGRIPDSAVREATRMTVAASGRRIGPEALDAAVAAADGFPYMLQLVGYHMWNERPESEEISPADVAHGITLARDELVESVLEFTYRDLSKGDRRFLAAMLPDTGASSIADIAARMGVKSNYASQYRRRLLEQGVIGEPQKGYVRFDLPMFREYLQERMGS